MGEQINIPVLRFPEFEGDWKECRLDEMTRWYSGGTPSKIEQQYWDGDIPWISASSMHGIEYGDSELKISNEGLKRGSRLAHKGWLLILVRGSMLFNKIPIGIATKDVAFNQDVKGIEVNSNSDALYILYYLYSKENKLLNIVTGTGIGAGKLDLDDLKSFKTPIPILSEQQKIASFFKAIDQKIPQLKRKKTLLELYKKGVMQKLFSQEIRFKDDNGHEFPDWEKKKLGECLDYIQPTKFIVNNTEYDDSFSTPVLTAGKSFILGYTDEEENIFSNPLPVIIFDDFTTSSQFVDFPFKVKSSAMKILVSKESVDIKFMFEAMNAIRYEVGGHERHWISKFAPIEIEIPLLSEQIKIANFLTAIDNKINHTQTQIEKAEFWKKGLLQKMFV